MRSTIAHSARRMAVQVVHSNALIGTRSATNILKVAYGVVRLSRCK